MNLRQLEVFQAVLQTGNMSAAARLLCITPSAVSKAVAHAELQLGYRLFNRTPTGLTPTPEAQVLATESTGIYRQLDALKRTARNLATSDSGEVRLGQFVAANLIILQLYQPLNLLGTVYREITQGLVDMEAMFRLLHQPQEVKDRPGARPLEVRGGEIKFDNVVCSYDPERIVLKGISFTVPAGKTVAVVGPSGAGKSTISRILYRFYDIQGGAVTIDGQDIRDITQESLRAVIGIVPQDTVLFNDTVKYNIAYGRIGASDAQIREAARLAQIDKFIDLLPQGYDSMVGERGLKLSGGEKQRVAIARTILKNPPILLLDEATSALDTGTEREIQSALNEVSRNRTSLVIAHRLSTVVDADEILVLDHGEIIERGRHSELLARNGHYAAMWNKQREAAAAREKLKEVENDPDVEPGIAKAAPV